MQAIILTAPPQARRVSMFMWNTRLTRFAFMLLGYGSRLRKVSWSVSDVERHKQTLAGMTAPGSFLAVRTLRSKDCNGSEPEVQ